MSDMPPLLEFSSVTKTFGQVDALGPISLVVPYGQLVALMGHNGSGKSTLLATAAGVLGPTDGVVQIAGALAGDQAARAAVTYLRDRPVLYEDLSLNEHLEYLSRLHGSSPEAHDMERVTAQLGIADRADDLPSNFSKGLRQKAAIAVGLCRPFALLLADEPFSGLDRDGRSAFLRLISDIRSEEGSVVVATHDLDAVEHFDRVIVLEHGTLIHDGPPNGLPI
jgi:ABC-type multidrug transport system ATPase subunit